MTTDTESPELKPCPFCGAPARVFSPGEAAHAVECTACVISSSFMETKAEAVSHWNFRAHLTTDAERRKAWDKYAAAALKYALLDTIDNKSTAVLAGKIADALLAERDKRWPRG